MSFARGRHVWMLLGLALAALGLIVLLVPRGTPAPPDALIFLGRASALVALWSMFLTILSAADVGGVSRLFGRSFRTVHYAVALTGLVAMVIHPLAVAVRLGTGEVFLPVVASWGAFWEIGGRVALYLFALVAALPALRRGSGRLARLGRRWRAFHLLAYPALLLAAVHGITIGRTHHLLGLQLASGAMVAVALGVLVLRRTRQG